MSIVSVVVYIYLAYDAYLREINLWDELRIVVTIHHLSDHKPLLQPITLTMNYLLCIKEVVKI